MALMIECRVGHNERVRLMTDLLDPAEFEALELAQFYHVRWDVELAFDELRTHLATVLHGTLHTTFRSQSPRGVRQEAYALFTAYNLIRGLMLAAGRAHSVPPLEISFLKTLRTIRRALPPLPGSQASRTAFADPATAGRYRRMSQSKTAASAPLSTSREGEDEQMETETPSAQTRARTWRRGHETRPALPRPEACSAGLIHGHGG